MLHKIIRFLWGDLSKEEIKKFGILSITFFFIICFYWLARPLKNALLSDLVGFKWQPFAKNLSLIINIFVVMSYGKLVDLFEKDKLFYIICPFFSIAFILLSFFSSNTNLLYINETSSFYPVISWIPGKIIGWLAYVSIEASSIIIALFWAFTASITKVESAKRGYAMIFFTGQTGQLIGPMIVLLCAQTLGSPFLLGLSGSLILFIPILIKFFMKSIPLKDRSLEKLEEITKEKTGFLGGLKLLLSKPYIMGICVIATSYEIIGTILEFQMNLIAENYFSRDLMAAFNAKFGMSVGALSMLFALLGTSFFMRKFGLKFCLISYPTMIGILVGSIFIVKMLFGFSNYFYMWTIFAAMIAIKGLNYTLNNPTKEVMYIPTSKDVKFKAKSWIDVFGNRTTKSIGANVCATFRTSPSDLMLYGTLISLGVVGFWIVIADVLGKTFNKLQKEKRIIK